MKYLQMIICLGFLLFLVPSVKAQKDTVTEKLNQTNDWPGLRRYRDENEKAGLPSAKENRVVFMGNSITDAWINASPDFFAKNPYLDRGISGQTTPQMLVRFRQDVIDLKPKVVIILAGINDIAGNTGPSSVEMIEDNLMSMAQLAKANNIKVVMCSILPAIAFPWRQGINPIEKIAAINKWMKSYTAKNNFVYVDYFDALADERKGLPPNLSKDGVHPTEAGYKIMEPLAVKGIEKALKQK
jgi:lysophospholipase L1-like esterase